MSLNTQSLGLAALQQGYRNGSLQVTAVIEELIQRRNALADAHIWISKVSDQQLRQRALALSQQDPHSLPLYGIPFAIKDNIDMAGLPTTAACPQFSYEPAESAYVVQRLLDAGAIALGKTNLDQFATGLVGVRSPYGIPRNSFDADYISGGSSSGSALAVAQGLCSFALGTDTAGSGRVPAAFNNLVGYKPSCGHLSTRGVVPACRSLDAVSVFALTAADAAAIGDIAGAYDAQDPWSRPLPASSTAGWSLQDGFRFAVPLPGQLDFAGNSDYAALFDSAVQRLQALGGIAVPLDIDPLLETARLLYEGPWVAERYLAVEALLNSDAEALLPVTRQIISGGRTPSATDAFRAQYRLQELKRQASALMAGVHVLLLPTAATHYRVDEVLADPIRTNSLLGRYTNFVNLLDMTAVSVPCGFTPAGLPFGASLIGTAGSDRDVLSLTARLQRASVQHLGASTTPVPGSDAYPWAAHTACIDVAVCGAHLSGLPLNHQLTSRKAWLRSSTRSAAAYKLYALPGGPPYRPGMVRTASDGVAIDVEVWSVPADQFGSFVAGIPAPLGIGKVLLQDGSQVCGFVCEQLAVADALDISHFGSWRRYLASLSQS